MKKPWAKMVGKIYFLNYKSGFIKWRRENTTFEIRIWLVNIMEEYAFELRIWLFNII